MSAHIESDWCAVGDHEGCPGGGGPPGIIGGWDCSCECHRQKPETTLPPMMTPEIEKQLRRAGIKAREWTLERDRLVKLAVERGASLREVGEAVGLSHTAVKFIAHGRPG